MRASPVAPNLFVTEPELRLLGGRHRQTSKLTFPLPDSEAYEAVELPQLGVLWSFTIQRFAPKSPPYLGGEPFVPFAVGYVELAGALIVESRLTDVSFNHLRVGMPMELTTIEMSAGGGAAVLAYAFKPKRAPDAAQ